MIPVIEVLILLTTFCVLIIASCTDLKTREVPDMLSYGFMVLGFVLHLMESVITQTPLPILSSIAGFTLMFILACVMFYTGQWGGGDSKIIMGMGAILGIPLTWPPQVLISNSVSSIAPLVLFIITSIFCGAVYGLFWTVGQAGLHAKAVFKELKENLSGAKTQKIKYILVGAAILGIGGALMLSNKYMSLLIITIILTVLILFYLTLFVKSVESTCMIKEVAISQVTEGDWIAKEVQVKGKYVCGPKDLGIEKEQLKKLQTLAKQNKIKTIWVKYGIPFVPSFLFGYILTVSIQYEIWKYF